MAQGMIESLIVEGVNCVKG